MHTVLIVDDHPVIRLAVRVLLEKHGLQVVAETDNGVDAIQLVREHEPDVVILDIGIPKLDGLTVISRIKSLELRTQVLVLTSQSAEAFCKRCIQVGARGFVNKEEDLNNLINALNAVIAGYTFFPSLTFDTLGTPPGLFRKRAYRPALRPRDDRPPAPRHGLFEQGHRREAVPQQQDRQHLQDPPAAEARPGFAGRPRGVRQAQFADPLTWRFAVEAQA